MSRSAPERTSGTQKASAGWPPVPPSLGPCPLSLRQFRGAARLLLRHPQARGVPLPRLRAAGALRRRRPAGAALRPVLRRPALTAAASAGAAAVSAEAETPAATDGAVSQSPRAVA